MPLTRRAAAPAVLALAALATAAGCTATNPQSTQTLRNPGDGTDVDLGPVHVASLLVVADEQGLGTLVARLVNSSLQPVEVSIADTGASGFSRTFTVPGSSTLAVGPQQDESVSIPRVGTAPGGIVDYTVDVAGTGQQTVPVPVLDGTLSEYRTLVPTASATTTPSPSATATATASASGSTSRPSTTPSRAGGTATASPGTVTQAPTTTGTAPPSPSQGATSDG